MKRTMKTLKVNDIFPIRTGGTVTVTKIINNLNIEVTHNDSYRYRHYVQLVNLNIGNIKNPYHPNVFDVGYIGAGLYSPTINGKHTEEYIKWRSMLNRCYYNQTQILQPCYADCTTIEEWHNFQNFAQWYVRQPNYGKSYQLDKDILIPGNKIYSPEACTLVPRIINTLFIDISNSLVSNGNPVGVYTRGTKFRAETSQVYIGTYSTREEASNAYLEYKKNYILEVAEQYKNDVDIRVYNRLIALANTKKE